MSRVITPENYLTEDEVLAQWPMLKASELRKARRTKAVDFYAFRSGPCYTAEQVQAYIDKTYLRKGDKCETTSTTAPAPEATSPPTRPSISMDGTSTARTQTAATAFMPAGMTPELATSAAALLEQQIGRSQKSDSRRSSSRRRPPQGQPSLALIKS
ncbi:hypothetical protein ACVMIH_001795 [Bradyrhizobium sp. USDA 4503]